LKLFLVSFVLHFMKEKLKYLDSLNLHLIEDVDISNIFKSPHFIELTTKFFNIRILKNFFGLFTKITIHHYDFKRIGYYDYEYNKDITKTKSLILPTYKVKDFLRFVEVKISTFNVLKSLDEIGEDDTEIQKKLTQDELFLIEDITRSSINNFYDKIYDNLKKFLNHLMINHFLNNPGDYIHWEHRVTDYGINYKGSLYKYNEKSMLAETTSYIYVDLTYDKNYFQVGLFDNSYVSLNIIHSSSNYEISRNCNYLPPNLYNYNPLEKDYIFTVDEFTGKVKFKIKGIDLYDYQVSKKNRDETDRRHGRNSRIYDYHNRPVFAPHPNWRFEDKSFFKTIGNFKLWRKDLDFLGNYDYEKDYGNKFSDMIYKNNIRIESELEGMESTESEILPDRSEGVYFVNEKQSYLTGSLNGGVPYIPYPH